MRCIGHNCALFLAFAVSIFTQNAAVSANSPCSIKPELIGLIQGIVHNSLHSERMLLIQRFHIRLNKEGLYEVLLPQPGGGFAVTQTGSLSEAFRIASTIQKPINLESLIAQHSPFLESLRKNFAGIEESVEGVIFTSRVKNIDRLKAKFFLRVQEFKKKGLELNLADIDDIVGMRYIVRSKSDLSLLTERLTNNIGILSRTGQIEGFTMDPKNKESGYRATHITLRVKDGTRAEIQLMTRRTLNWSNWDHPRRYKPTGTSSPMYLRQMQAYSHQIIRYLNQLDDGVPKFKLVKPNFKQFGIKPNDRFPDEMLN